ncbi:MAG: hypothetical protein R3C52_00660 [Hyphomonadaceae bacterium]
MKLLKRMTGLGGLICATLLAASCDLVTSTNQSVFILFDASGTYAKSAPAAARSASLLVSKLQPGDWIGAGQISSCSFSEKEILLQEQLPETPSRADAAKREIFGKLKTYSEQIKPTKFTDIRGALAQAAFELRQRPEASRSIIVFSDMIEDLAKDCNTSGVSLDLSGITVVASNVIKSSPADPDKYFAMLDDWEKVVTDAGGKWVLVASPDQLTTLVAQR